MMKSKSTLLFGYGMVTATALAATYNRFDLEQRDFLLPGKTSNGHYQIELACNQCHTPYGGVTQEACIGCHGAELERADDSHPPKKFRDPRNADRLERIDALHCVTCHVEHEPDSTGAMGLTQPGDYCFYCHSDIGDERETHRGLLFATCQDAGCHNFHDNRSLHEDFLQAHLDEPATFERAVVPLLAPPSPPQGAEPLRFDDEDAPDDLDVDPQWVADWARSAHARAAVNCSDCHGGTNGTPFEEKPGMQPCRKCHAGQVEGFQEGRHGMRLAVGLSAMTPDLARLPMKAAARDLRLGCTSCHGAHRFDRQHAAVDACLGCHDDLHSRAYKASMHYRLFIAEWFDQTLSGIGVSCATCHLPRADDPSSGELHVQHNQNDNLRPNEKMVRSVCNQCHGVEFSLSALSDPALIERNFDAPPAVKVEGVSWVRARRAAHSGD